jgi:hypothetical protein
MLPAAGLQFEGAAGAGGLDHVGGVVHRRPGAGPRGGRCGEHAGERVPVHHARRARGFPPRPLAPLRVPAFPAGAAVLRRRPVRAGELGCGPVLMAGGAFARLAGHALLLAQAPTSGYSGTVTSSGRISTPHEMQHQPKSSKTMRLAT